MPDATRLARYALGAAIGIAGALVFVALNLPLPWFLGALAGSFVASVAGVRFLPPSLLADPVRAILGVAVGAAFTPEIVSRFGPMALSLSLILPWVLLIVAAGTLVFSRLFGIDRKTALFASVPGGLTDMVTMAEDAGANVRTVTLVQLTRIALLVFLLPLYLQWRDGLNVTNLAFAGKTHVWDMTARNVLELVAMSTAGIWIARQLHIAGPAIVGPMILSAIAHATGLSAFKVPFELMIVAQVTLGILLGAQFRGLTRLEFRTTLVAGFIFASLLLAMTLVFSAFVEWLTGFRGPPVIMSFAPGGQAELNLLALSLNLDIAFIALHHLVRLAVVMAIAQVIARSGGPPG